MQIDLRVCASCSRQLQPGVEYCPNCGADQAASKGANAPPSPRYSEAFQQPTGPSEAFQSPTGLGAAALQPLPGQPAFAMQPGMMPLLLKPRISASAVTSLVVGIV